LFLHISEIIVKSDQRKKRRITQYHKNK